MTLTIDLTLDQEARLRAAALRELTEPEALVQRWVDCLPESPKSTSALHSVDPENDASIALLQSWLAEDATTDPEEIRQAEHEMREFKRNMNASRRESGARLLFPEAE